MAVCPSWAQRLTADGQQSTCPEVRNGDADSGIHPGLSTELEAENTDKPRATVREVVDPEKHPPLTASNGE